MVLIVYDEQVLVLHEDEFQLPDNQGVNYWYDLPANHIPKMLQV